MKRMMILLVMALVMFSGNVFAATSATLNVTATVVGSCEIQAGTFAFGSVDNFDNTDLNPTVLDSVQIKCGSGIGYAVSDDGGANGGLNDALNGNALMDGTLGGQLKYKLAYPTSGTGTGALENISITGTIAAVDFQAAAADSYSDAVVLTIAPTP
ncbi:MAG: hypothetical protein C0619_13860 [Desulfuromonas sp.]|nr:MAG: hypothetical protein C0619_13860 [Desulfuromonas sp.]